MDTVNSDILDCPDIKEKLELYDPTANGKWGDGAEHAILMPSKSHRWVHCPGSVQAEAAYPQPPSESAEEGTAAHWVAAEVLKSYQDPDDNFFIASDFEGATAPNDVIINEEMVEAASIYIHDVLKVCQKDGLLSKMQIEHRVEIDRVHAHNWGTSDCVIWTPGRLIVWDFKYGRKAVENHRNWQLIEYAIGALDEQTGGNGLADQEIIVEMRIVQPRAFHVDGVCRDWKLQGSNLRGYVNQLAHSAEKSQQDDPPTKTGEHCENCTASRGCLTLQRDAAGICERVESLQLHDLSPADTSVELRYLRKSQTLLNERLDSLESQALEQTKSGTVIPGFGVGYGRGSTDWIGTDAEVIVMGDLMDVDLRKPEAPLTPKQAEKKNLDGAVIKSYSIKKPGSARLVEDKNTIAGRVFGNQSE